MCNGSRQADALNMEIEVSPKMIDAGVDEYLAYCPDTGLGDGIDRRMVGEIFKAMIRALRAADRET